MHAPMPEPIDDLRAAQPPLLALHKALLDAEREQVERVHGRMSGPEFLQLISDPVRYGWLKPFSQLILAVDDTLDPKDDEPHLEPQELLEHDLVDELRLMVYPVVLGSGKRLFGDTSDRKPLRLVDSKVVGDGVAILIYQPATT